jgi:phytoene synthase
MAETQTFESGTLDPPTDSGADQRAVDARVRASGTSFFWAMRFLPEEKRAAIFAVYAFCREVDDIADGDLGAEAKRTALAAWRAEIERLYEGHPGREITRALLGPVRRYALEKDAFLAVIDGMEMDALGPIRAPSAADLELYCARVAGAVGLLSVRIFGMAGRDGPRLADTLGRALQLTNILRDLHEDAQIGRLYLPRELLQSHGIETTEPVAVLAHPQLRAVARELGAKARGSFSEARAIMERNSADTVRPARIMMEVYDRALRHLEETDFAGVELARAKGGLAGFLSKAGKLAVALRYGIF